MYYRLAYIFVFVMKMWSVPGRMDGQQCASNPRLVIGFSTAIQGHNFMC